MVKHEIDTGEARAIKQASRTIPLAKRNEVKGLVDDMKRSCVIELSSGPWSSLVVLVEKKDGSIRFCIDYRKPNDVTKKDSYSLPRIGDTLDTLAGNPVKGWRRFWRGFTNLAAFCDYVHTTDALCPTLLT